MSTIFTDSLDLASARTSGTRSLSASASRTSSSEYDPASGNWLTTATKGTLRLSK